MSLLDIHPAAKLRHNRNSETQTYHYDNSAIIKDELPEKLHVADLETAIDSAEQLRTTLRAFDELQTHKERFEDSDQVAGWLIEDTTKDSLLLARTIMLNKYADDLELPPTPSNTPSRAPTLEDVYLLAKAYDITQNDTIKLSLEYVLYDNPPGLHDFIKAAYKRSRQHNTLIMDEYYTIDKKFTHASHLPIEDTF